MIDEHEQIMEEVAAHALGVLDDDARARTEAHLQTCAECRELLREYGAVAGLLPFEMPLETPPPSAWAAIEARLAGTGAAALPPPLPFRRRAGRGLRTALFAGAIAAALLLVGIIVLVQVIRGAPHNGAIVARVPSAASSVPTTGSGGETAESGTAAGIGTVAATTSATSVAGIVGPVASPTPASVSPSSAATALRAATPAAVPTAAASAATLVRTATSLPIAVRTATPAAPGSLPAVGALPANGDVAVEPLLLVLAGIIFVAGGAALHRDASRHRRP